MSNYCKKKIIGNRPISSATPNELRRIEKCMIIAAGGNYTGPLKEKRGYKQPDSLKRKGSSKMENIYKSPGSKMENIYKSPDGR